VKNEYAIVALPGDGVGQEVVAQGLRVLARVGQIVGVNFTVTAIECGGHYYAEHGIEWPDGSFEKCQSADAILLGAVGHVVDGKTVFTQPGKPYDQPQLAGFAQVIGNRQKLNLYANVRPIKLYEGVPQKISDTFQKAWNPEKVDYVVVRENTEDAYSGDTFEIQGGKQTPINITEAATERVVRFACELAKQRNKQGKVTCVDKSNIVGAHTFFREIFDRVVDEEFPDLEADHAYCNFSSRRPTTWWWPPTWWGTWSATTAALCRAAWGWRPLATSVSDTQCLNPCTAQRRR